MTQILAYLTFKGNCRAAMEFYRDCLGAELRLQTVGDTPMAAQMPPDSHGMIMHADLTKGGLRLMASDLVGDYPFNPGDTISLMLYCDTEAEVRGYFAKLSAGGTVNQPLEEQFWGAVYGDLTDKFGLRWMLNWDKPKT